MAVAVVALAAGLVATGCVGTAPREPTLPSTNFSPKLVIEVRDKSVRFVRGPREDPNVALDPPVVPGGTVVDVVNLDTRDHRLQAGTTFDTGTMRRDERTTIVMVNDTSEDKTIDITDADEPTTRATITVKPRLR